MNSVKSHIVPLYAFLMAILFYPTLGTTQDTFRAEVVVRVDLSHHEPEKEARVWLPYPVSDRYQTISDIKIRGTFTQSAVYTDNGFKNPMLYAQWGAGKGDRRLELSFKVERRERKDRPSQDPGVAYIDKGFFSRYLTSSSLLSLNEGVIARAREITQKCKTPFEKALAIYEWVTSHMERDPKTRGCGRGDVCYLLFKKPSGKCADISSVFVALLRAAGIPAREVFGLRLSGQGEPRDITQWQHCWSEFYLPGQGWVVADPADFLKFSRKKGIRPCSNAAKALRDYYFGTVDPRRVRFSTGRDIVLNPRQQGAPLNYFMYPYAEIGGRVLDYLSPDEFSYNITCIPIN